MANYLRRIEAPEQRFDGGDALLVVPVYRGESDEDARRQYWAE
jgi:hypothetical protein